MRNTRVPALHALHCQRALGATQSSLVGSTFPRCSGYSARIMAGDRPGSGSIGSFMAGVAFLNVALF
jgi:hypothetical protein